MHQVPMTHSILRPACGIHSAHSPRPSACIRVDPWLKGWSQEFAFSCVDSRFNRGVMPSRLRAFAVQSNEPRYLGCYE